MAASFFLPHGDVINIFGGRCARGASIFIFALALAKGPGVPAGCCAL